MSDAVLITITITISAAVIVVLLIFRKQISSFFFKAGKDGVQAEMKVRKQSDSTDPKSEPPKGGKRADVSIRGNKLVGKKNEIGVSRRGVDVSENVLLGTGHGINVKPSPVASKKKR